MTYRKSLAKSIIAVVTAVAFLTVNGIGFAAPVAPNRTEITLPSYATLARQLDFKVPDDLGTVDLLRAGTDPQKPAIIHIQTAHGNYEAQKKIQAILRHFYSRYGLKALLLEGAQDELDPQVLNFFPEDPSKTALVNDELTKAALVKGPELFLLDEISAMGHGPRATDKARTSDPDRRATNGKIAQDQIVDRAPKHVVRALGIEDSAAHRANLRSFAEVLQAKEKSRAFLAQMDESISRIQSQYLNAGLRKFVKGIEDHELGITPLKSWLSSLKKDAASVLSLDLGHPGNQIEWPMLVRYYAVERFGEELDRDRFEAEKKRFLAAVRSSVSEDTLSGIGKLLEPSALSARLPSPATSDLFEKMIRELPRTFDYRIYPNLNRHIGILILASEIDPMRLFSEVGTIEDLIAGKFSVTPEEKALVAMLKDHRSLRKLFALELTPDDYDGILVRKDDLRPSKIVESLTRAAYAVRRTKAVEFSHLQELDELFEKAMVFYAGVKSRDGSMLANIEKRIAQIQRNESRVESSEFGAVQSQSVHSSSPNSFVIITGGFHARPFEDELIAKGYTYARVSPRITGSDAKGHAAYVDLATRLGSALKDQTLETYYLSAIQNAPGAAAAKVQLQEAAQAFTRYVKGGVISEKEKRKALKRLSQAFFKKDSAEAVMESLTETSASILNAPQSIPIPEPADRIATIVPEAVPGPRAEARAQSPAVVSKKADEIVAARRSENVRSWRQAGVVLLAAAVGFSVAFLATSPFWIWVGLAIAEVPPITFAFYELFRWRFPHGFAARQPKAPEEPAGPAKIRGEKPPESAEPIDAAIVPPGIHPRVHEGKTVFVPGGGGYVGGAVVRALLAAGSKVIVFDNKDRKNTQLPSSRDLQYIKGDIRDAAAVRDAMKGADAVVHLAAYIEAGVSVNKPGMYFRNNVIGTTNVLDGMVANGIRRLAFASSAGVYSGKGLKGDEVLTEDVYPDPQNPYGETKLMMEKLMADYGKRGIRFGALRFFNVAGALPDHGEDHQPESHLLPLIMYAALGVRDSIKIFGEDYETPDGTGIRDYIHVADIANAHLRMLAYLYRGGESQIINLGTGKGTSGKEAIKTVEEVSDRRVPVVKADRRPGDPAILRAGHDLATQVLGWKPLRDFTRIVSDAWDYHSRRQKKESQRPVPPDTDLSTEPQDLADVLRGVSQNAIAGPDVKFEILFRLFVDSLDRGSEVYRNARGLLGREGTARQLFETDTALRAQFEELAARLRGQTDAKSRELTRIYDFLNSLLAPLGPREASPASPTRFVSETMRVEPVERVEYPYYKGPAVKLLDAVNEVEIIVIPEFFGHIASIKVRGHEFLYADRGSWLGWPWLGAQEIQDGRVTTTAGETIDLSGAPITIAKDGSAAANHGFARQNIRFESALKNAADGSSVFEMTLNSSSIPNIPPQLQGVTLKRSLRVLPGGKVEIENSQDRPVGFPGEHLVFDTPAREEWEFDIPAADRAYEGLLSDQTQAVDGVKGPVIDGMNRIYSLKPGVTRIRAEGPRGQTVEVDINADESSHVTVWAPEKEKRAFGFEPDTSGPSPLSFGVNGPLTQKMTLTLTPPAEEVVTVVPEDEPTVSADGIPEISKMAFGLFKANQTGYVDFGEGRIFSRPGLGESLVLLIKPSTGAITQETIAEILRSAEKRGYFANALRVVDAKTIRDQRIIERHYPRHAEVALRGLPALDPDEIEALRKNLEERERLGFAAATMDNVISAADLIDKSGITAGELMKEWKKANAASDLREKTDKIFVDGKRARAFRVAPVTVPNDPRFGLYAGRTFMVLNGFYPDIAGMFERATRPTVAILLKKDPSNPAAWSLVQMKEDFAGDTDPAKAAPESLRGRAFRNDPSLDLPPGTKLTIEANLVHLTDVADIPTWPHDSGEFNAWFPEVLSEPSFRAEARVQARELIDRLGGVERTHEILSGLQTAGIHGETIFSETKPDLFAPDAAGLEEELRGLLERLGVASTDQGTRGAILSLLEVKRLELPGVRKYLVRTRPGGPATGRSSSEDAKVIRQIIRMVKDLDLFGTQDMPPVLESDVGLRRVIAQAVTLARPGVRVTQELVDHYLGFFRAEQVPGTATIAWQVVFSDLGTEASSFVRTWMEQNAVRYREVMVGSRSTPELTALAELMKIHGVTVITRAAALADTVKAGAPVHESMRTWQKITTSPVTAALSVGYADHEALLPDFVREAGVFMGRPMEARYREAMLHEIVEALVVADWVLWQNRTAPYFSSYSLEDLAEHGVSDPLTHLFMFRRAEAYGLTHQDKFMLARMAMGELLGLIGKYTFFKDVFMKKKNRAVLDGDGKKFFKPEAAEFLNRLGPGSSLALQFRGILLEFGRMVLEDYQDPSVMSRPGPGLGVMVELLQHFSEDQTADIRADLQKHYKMQEVMIRFADAFMRRLDSNRNLNKDGFLLASPEKFDMPGQVIARAAAEEAGEPERTPMEGNIPSERAEARSAPYGTVLFPLVGMGDLFGSSSALQVKSTEVHSDDWEGQSAARYIMAQAEFSGPFDRFVFNVRHEGDKIRSAVLLAKVKNSSKWCAVNFDLTEGKVDDLLENVDGMEAKPDMRDLPAQITVNLADQEFVIKFSPIEYRLTKAVFAVIRRYGSTELEKAKLYSLWNFWRANHLFKDDWEATHPGNIVQMTLRGIDSYLTDAYHFSVRSARQFRKNLLWIAAGSLLLLLAVSFDPGWFLGTVMAVFLAMFFKRSFNVSSWAAASGYFSAKLHRLIEEHEDEIKDFMRDPSTLPADPFQPVTPDAPGQPRAEARTLNIDLRGAAAADDVAEIIQGRLAVSDASSGPAEILVRVKPYGAESARIARDLTEMGFTEDRNSRSHYDHLVDSGIKALHSDWIKGVTFDGDRITVELNGAAAKTQSISRLVFQRTEFFGNETLALRAGRDWAKLKDLSQKQGFLNALRTYRDQGRLALADVESAAGVDWVLEDEPARAKFFELFGELAAAVRSRAAIRDEQARRAAAEKEAHARQREEQEARFRAELVRDLEALRANWQALQPAIDLRGGDRFFVYRIAEMLIEKKAELSRSQKANSQSALTELALMKNIGAMNFDELVLAIGLEIERLISLAESGKFRPAEDGKRLQKLVEEMASLSTMVSLNADQQAAELDPKLAETGLAHRVLKRAYAIENFWKYSRSVMVSISVMGSAGVARAEADNFYIADSSNVVWLQASDKASAAARESVLMDKLERIAGILEEIVKMYTDAPDRYPWSQESLVPLYREIIRELRRTDSGEEGPESTIRLGVSQQLGTLLMLDLFYNWHDKGRQVRPVYTRQIAQVVDLWQSFFDEAGYAGLTAKKVLLDNATPQQFRRAEARDSSGIEQRALELVTKISGEGFTQDMAQVRRVAEEYVGLISDIRAAVEELAGDIWGVDCSDASTAKPRIIQLLQQGEGLGRAYAGLRDAARGLSQKARMPEVPEDNKTAAGEAQLKYQELYQRLSTIERTALESPEDPHAVVPERLKKAVYNLMADIQRVNADPELVLFLRQWLGFEDSGKTGPMREGVPDALVRAEARILVPEEFRGINQKVGTNGWRSSVGASVFEGNYNVYTIGRMAEKVAVDLERRGVVDYLVGFDNRPNSDVFALVFARVLKEHGIRVVFSDRPIPSPAQIRATGTAGLPDEGVIITASHNAPTDNGIKFFAHGVVLADSSAIPLTADVVNYHEFRYPSATVSGQYDPFLGEFETVDLIGSTRSHYVTHFPDLKRIVDHAKASGAELVLDHMHGSSSALAGYFREAGLEVIEGRTRPMSEVWREAEFRAQRFTDSGKEVPYRPEPKTIFLDEERFERFKGSAPAGSLYFAIDGDADRLAIWVKREDGSVLEVAPNDLGLLYGKLIIDELLAKAGAEDETVYYVAKTQPTTSGMDFLVKYANLRAGETGKKVTFKLEVTPVGSKHFGDKYKEGRLLIGVEESGHIVMKDFFDDAAGQLHFLLKSLNGRSLAEAIGTAKAGIGEKAGVDLKSLGYQRVNVPVTEKFTGSFLDPIKGGDPKGAFEALSRELGAAKASGKLGGASNTVTAVRMTQMDGQYSTSGFVLFDGENYAVPAEGYQLKENEGFHVSFGDGSWVMIRVSGTEGLVRVYAEAFSGEDIAELQSAVARAFGLDIKVAPPAPKPAEPSQELPAPKLSAEEEQAYLTALRSWGIDAGSPDAKYILARMLSEKARALGGTVVRTIFGVELTPEQREAAGYISETAYDEVRFSVSAKKAFVRVIPLHGGLGEKLRRELWKTWLGRHGLVSEKMLARDAEGNIGMGAKGTDTGVLIFDPHGQLRFVSAAEGQLVQLIRQAAEKRFSGISFQAIVNKDSKASFEELFERPSLDDPFKTYGEVLEEVGIVREEFLFQRALPAIEPRTGFPAQTKEGYAQEAGHGQIGMHLVANPEEYQPREDGAPDFWIFHNGDNANGSDIDPRVVGYMIENGLMMGKLAVVATRIDKKGGKEVVWVVRVGDKEFLLSNQMEIAEAKAAGAEAEARFEAAGQPEGVVYFGEDSVGNQRFNTNTFVIQASLLMPLLAELKKAMGAERYFTEVVKPLFLAKDVKKGKDGKDYLPMDSAIGNLMHALNSFVVLMNQKEESSMTETDRQVLGILKKHHADRILSIFEVSRTPHFVPQKNPFDTVILLIGGLLKLNREQMLFEEAVPGFQPPKISIKDSKGNKFDSGKGRYSELLTLIRTFAGSGDAESVDGFTPDDLMNSKFNITRLDALELEGDILLQESELIGTVTVRNRSGRVVDLNDLRYGLPRNADGLLKLENIEITIDEEGDLAHRFLTAVSPETSPAGEATAPVPVDARDAATAADRGEGSGTEVAADPLVRVVEPEATATEVRDNSDEVAGNIRDLLVGRVERKKISPEGGEIFKRLAAEFQADRSAQGLVPAVTNLNQKLDRNVDRLQKRAGHYARLRGIRGWDTLGSLLVSALGIGLLFGLAGGLIKWVSAASITAFFAANVWIWPLLSVSTVVGLSVYFLAKLVSAQIDRNSALDELQHFKNARLGIDLAMRSYRPGAASTPAGVKTSPKGGGPRAEARVIPEARLRGMADILNREVVNKVVLQGWDNDSQMGGILRRLFDLELTPEEIAAYYAGAEHPAGPASVILSVWTAIQKKWRNDFDGWDFDLIAADGKTVLKDRRYRGAKYQGFSSEKMNAFVRALIAKIPELGPKIDLGDVRAEARSFMAPRVIPEARLQKIADVLNAHFVNKPILSGWWRENSPEAIVARLAEVEISLEEHSDYFVQHHARLLSVIATTWSDMKARWSKENGGIDYDVIGLDQKTVVDGERYVGYRGYGPEKTNAFVRALMEKMPGLGAKIDFDAPRAEARYEPPTERDLIAFVQLAGRVEKKLPELAKEIAKLASSGNGLRKSEMFLQGGDWKIIVLRDASGRYITLSLAPVVAGSEATAWAFRTDLLGRLHFGLVSPDGANLAMNDTDFLEPWIEDTALVVSKPLIFVPDPGEWFTSFMLKSSTRLGGRNDALPAVRMHVLSESGPHWPTLFTPQPLHDILALTPQNARETGNLVRSTVAQIAELTRAGKITQSGAIQKLSQEIIFLEGIKKRQAADDLRLQFLKDLRGEIIRNVKRVRNEARLPGIAETGFERAELRQMTPEVFGRETPAAREMLGIVEPDWAELIALEEYRNWIRAESAGDLAAGDRDDLERWLQDRGIAAPAGSDAEFFERRALSVKDYAVSRDLNNVLRDGFDLAPVYGQTADVREADIGQFVALLKVFGDMRVTLYIPGADGRELNGLREKILARLPGMDPKRVQASAVFTKSALEQRVSPKGIRKIAVVDTRKNADLSSDIVDMYSSEQALFVRTLLEHHDLTFALVPAALLKGLAKVLPNGKRVMTDGQLFALLGDIRSKLEALRATATAA